jgi:hypothetical protein
VIGLLWLDWLLRRFHATRLSEFVSTVVAPLALSALFASLLGIYQGMFDLHFLSGGSWPIIQRAAGSMVDANAFGMIAALWTGGALALFFGESRQSVGAQPACSSLAGAASGCRGRGRLSQPH